MRWPIWFPYPMAFVYTLLLFALVSILIALLIPVYGVMSALGLGIALVAGVLAGDFGVGGFILLVLTPLVLIAPFWMIALEYQCVHYAADLFAHKEPHFTLNPSSKCWRDAVFGLGLLCLLMIAIVAIWPIQEYCNVDMVCRTRKLTEAEKSAMSFLLVVLLTYAYHIRILRQQMLARQRERQEKARKRRNVAANKASLPRANPVPAPKPMPPKSAIDEELEELKRKLRGE